MSRSCGSNSRRLLGGTAVYIKRFAPFGNEEEKKKKTKKKSSS
jgi:hypothetical protein